MKKVLVAFGDYKKADFELPENTVVAKVREVLGFHSSPGVNSETILEKIGVRFDLCS